MERKTKPQSYPASNTSQLRMRSGQEGQCITANRTPNLCKLTTKGKFKGKLIYKEKLTKTETENCTFLKSKTG
ncbi:hypothetical protein L596_017343 [Steinernema carpocapsae]|uniref:Uncharacterized protein n=1 Tax=Steinernema carpocapsae TaxID=34508 RepID=A0A4U5N1C9_STECR|nr:hypothetical protein L596_017343 [Steinernema carpocapsae]